MTRKGVWKLQQVRDKYLQSLWANPNNLFIAGKNEAGSLGQNQRYDAPSPGDTGRSSPLQIDGDWNDVSILEKGIGGIKTDGTLWAWGENEYGQTGDNSTVYKSSPTQIPGTTWNRIGGGREVILATKTDGTLWAWGNNQYGQLGQNNETRYSSPVQVGSDTTWHWPVTSGYTSGAVKTDGTLWTWGDNGNRCLGHNNPTNSHRSSPVQCSSADNVTQAEFGKEASYFVSGTSGFSMGTNAEGQLGQNNETNYSSPKQVSGSWKALSCGSDKVGGGIKTDGTLWAFGDGTSGVLGQNEAGVKHTSPKQIGSDTTWRTLTGAKDGSACFIATKTDGTLWAWGANTGGKFMQNNQTQRSSPIQIPGTLWSSNWWQHSVDGGDSMHASIQSTLTPSQL